jgi:hypothetical protein
MNSPGTSESWCPGRVRLAAPPEPTAPCMLHAGHAGEHSAATTVIEDHAPKRAKKNGAAR